MDAVVSWDKTETVMAGSESGNSTNEQPYAEFSDSKPPPTIFLGRFGIPRTEFILGVSLAAAVVVCIILIPFAAQGGGSSSVPDIPTDSYCLTPQCLETAGQLVSSMDASVKPCDNFHQYACGNWKYVHPLESDQTHRTVRTEHAENNKEKILRILEGNRDTNWTTEGKVRAFFSSCMDEYSRQESGGQVFISQILRYTGGWYVLDSYDEGTYDINDVFQKVHIDFWTDVLFKFRVTVDQEDPTENVLELDLGGLGMYWVEYTLQDSQANAARRAYREFIRKVGKALVTDSGESIDDDVVDQRLDTFVDDVMTIETELANITKNSVGSIDPHFNKVSLARLTLDAGYDLIDFTDFFRYGFVSAGVSDTTMIALREQDYIYKVMDMLNNMNEQDPSMLKRRLNNYFTWRMAQTYAWGMSYKYIHAEREFTQVFEYGEITVHPDLKDVCFYYMSYHLHEALSALFVQDHFADQQKPMAHAVVVLMLNHLYEKGLDLHASWMDDATKTTAKEKLISIQEKLGYADYLANRDSVDAYYMSFRVDPTSFFKNILYIGEYELAQLNKELNSGEDRNVWRVHAYDVYSEYYNPWNELLVPAGLLQWPYFTPPAFPQVLNFAGFGADVSRQLLHAIDELGSYFQPDGSQEEWWSEETTTNYAEARKCAVDFYSNQTAGPYDVPGLDEPVSLPIKGFTAARVGISDIGGLRNAFWAWRNSYKVNSVPRLPLPDMTQDQVFFLAYAQNFCFVRDPVESYILVANGGIPEDIRVNAAVSSLPQFAQAFNCPAGSPMNATTKCEIF